MIVISRVITRYNDEPFNSLPWHTDKSANKKIIIIILACHMACRYFKHGSKKYKNWKFHSFIKIMFTIIVYVTTECNQLK
jgi:hypothetical protein